MKKTKNTIASAANINFLSTLTQNDLCNVGNYIRYNELKGYSKEQQDDFIQDGIAHACEVYNSGYFFKKEVATRDEFLALFCRIASNKAADERNKLMTFRKHVDVKQKDISEILFGKKDILDLEDSSATFSTLTDEVSGEDEFLSAANDYINALPGKEGLVLWMTHQGYSDDEIVEDLKMSRGSVHKARSTARSKVVSFMKSLGYGRSNSSSKARPSAEADASADFFCHNSKNVSKNPLIIVNQSNKTMINIDISKNKRKSHSISQSISNVRLDFKDGALLGNLAIGIESGHTKRKVRRILEKRVNQDYWSHVRKGQIRDNRHRASSKKYVSSVTRKIFGGPVTGYEYWT